MIDVLLHSIVLGLNIFGVLKDGSRHFLISVGFVMDILCLNRVFGVADRYYTPIHVDLNETYDSNSTLVYFASIALQLRLQGVKDVEEVIPRLM